MDGSEKGLDQSKSSLGGRGGRLCRPDRARGPAIRSYKFSRSWFNARISKASRRRVRSTGHDDSAATPNEKAVGGGISLGRVARGRGTDRDLDRGKRRSRGACQTGRAPLELSTSAAQPPVRS